VNDASAGTLRDDKQWKLTKLDVTESVPMHQALFFESKY
jgi:hypothetical protein